MRKTKAKTVPFLESLKESKSSRSVHWTRRKAEIRNSKNEIIFSLKNVLAPDFWSQTAVEIAASKYFRKISPRIQENSILQLVQRVTESVGKEALRQKYFSKAKSLSFARELEELLLHQEAWFNSPVWFNCGLWDKYQLKSQMPLFAWDSKIQAIKKYSNGFEKPQVSACFILKISDDLESIFEFAKVEARIFKYGSGSGANFTPLRSHQESLSGGGVSSGLIAFLEVLDRGAGAIKSGGVTRRAAKMVCLDIDHPEILEFIDWKMKEERKAQALIAAGYSSDFEGEAYHTIAGQNANLSVRIPDQFFRALEKNLNWSLKSPSTGKVIRQVPAAEIWRKIQVAAWTCADPGLQFETTIEKWNPCPATGSIRASNPCSEYMFLDETACNLASLNLMAFRGDGGRNSFELQKYLAVIKAVFTAQDILIDSAGYPTEAIALNSHRLRPLGLGLCGLGGFLMSRGISYDSEEGRAWAGFLAAVLQAQSIKTSALLAKQMGAFPEYSKNKKTVLSVLLKHQRALNQISWKSLPIGLEGSARQLMAEALNLARKYGLRNAQLTVMAPTGTIGLVMDCDTTGIEPEYALIKFKKMVGGGVMKMSSNSFQSGLKSLGYSSNSIEKINKYLESEGHLESCPDLQPEHLSVFLTAQRNGSSQLCLRPEAHLLMMAAIQPFISGAISKTVNLPSSATPEDIEKIYQMAWQLGLKSVSVYRDQSKSSQPLQSFKNQACPECGGKTEIAGNCYRCQNCGYTTGCVA